MEEQIYQQDFSSVHSYDELKHTATIQNPLQLSSILLPLEDTMDEGIPYKSLLQRRRMKTELSVSVIASPPGMMDGTDEFLDPDL